MGLFDRFKNWITRGDKMNINQKDIKPNELFDTVMRQKQDDYLVWFSGDSDKLMKRYTESLAIKQGSARDHFKNTEDYFWATASKEKNVKCTHSSIPRTIVTTLVKLMGKPDFRVLDEEDNDVINDEKRLNEILKESNFYDILKKRQEPLSLVVGDGAYLVSIDREISDSPIIEFIDGRNCYFEWKANRIIAVTVRRFYSHEDKGYCLFERRSTRSYTVEGKIKRRATIEYKLYSLKNNNTEEVNKEVPLNTIPQTSALENLIFNHIDTMLAIPVIYDLDTETNRGLSIFSSKLDLFDDLDQVLSQSSNTIRLSTPVEYFPEGLAESTPDGRFKAPNRFDRRYVAVPSDRNSVGQNVNKIEMTQPDIQVDKYNSAALEILHNILSGLMSPATLGIDLARNDNAMAQREKEKVTLVTRDHLVDVQSEILTKLFNLVLKIDDFMSNPNEQVGEYTININYPEYANPTFDAKLEALVPALVSGGMSPEKYVDELWGDSLGEEERLTEIEYITSARTPAQALGMEPMDLFSFDDTE